MSFLRTSFFILMLSFLLPACFHDGPTILTDNNQDNNGGTTQNKGLPTITATSPSNPDLTVNESENSIIFSVTLSEPVSEDIDISYQATALAGVSNSATRQDDFLLFSQGRNASSDSVTIAAGATEANFAVNINRDLVDESNEVFAVNIKIVTPEDSSPRATVITPQLVVTIVDDDPLPIIELKSDYGTQITVKESIGVIKLQLRMPQSLSANNVEIPVKIGYPSSQAATAGEDFINPGSLIYPAVTTDNSNPGIFSFELLIRDDAVKEGNETFYFSLLNPLFDAATLGPNTAALTITIEDDDANGGINDTQVITCADNNNPSTACGNSDFPLQDGDTNTDYNFRWLDSFGNTTTNDANAVCVEDINTGLVWEIKSTDGTSHRYYNYTFSWFNNLSNTNGGHNGISGGNTSCDSTLDDCSTKTYMTELNRGDGLCSNTNWRLPRVHELVSIMNFQPFQDATNTVMIKTNDFPNTVSGYYWTASPVADFTLDAWAVYFGKTPPRQPNTEFTVPYDKSQYLYVRAVANSK